jgi:hypothetical protein
MHSKHRKANEHTIKIMQAELDRFSAEVERLRECLTSLRREIEAEGMVVGWQGAETGRWHLKIAKALAAKE